MSNSVQEQTLATVFGRYDRRVMNNIHRADYVECLVAMLLGPAWTLPWTSAYDWAPWDLEHVSGARIEAKQAAARQPWHRDESVPAHPAGLSGRIRTAGARKRRTGRPERRGGTGGGLSLRPPVRRRKRGSVRTRPSRHAGHNCHLLIRRGAAGEFATHFL